MRKGCWTARGAAAFTRSERSRSTRSVDYRRIGTKEPLGIKDPETELLARALAERTGETLTVATRRALEERLRRIGGGAARRAALLEDLAASRRRWSKMSVLDTRGADEIIGYDENGLPR
jgi:antitoxin VapB